jgi:hypothetical protein
MTIALATQGRVITERILALGKAVNLEVRADRLEQEGKPVDASVLRSRARTIRNLWEIP